MFSGQQIWRTGFDLCSSLPRKVGRFTQHWRWSGFKPNPAIEFWKPLWRIQCGRNSSLFKTGNKNFWNKHRGPFAPPLVNGDTELASPEKLLENYYSVNQKQPYLPHLFILPAKWLWKRFGIFTGPFNKLWRKAMSNLKDIQQIQMLIAKGKERGFDLREEEVNKALPGEMNNSGTIWRNYRYFWATWNCYCWLGKGRQKNVRCRRKRRWRVG